MKSGKILLESKEQVENEKEVNNNESVQTFIYLFSNMGSFIYPS